MFEFTDPTTGDTLRAEGLTFTATSPTGKVLQSCTLTRKDVRKLLDCRRYNQPFPHPCFHVGEFPPSCRLRLILIMNGVDFVIGQPQELALYNHLCEVITSEVFETQGVTAAPEEGAVGLYVDGKRVTLSGTQAEDLGKFLARVAQNTGG